MALPKANKSQGSHFWLSQEQISIRVHTFGSSECRRPSSAPKGWREALPCRGAKRPVVSRKLTAAGKAASRPFGPLKSRFEKSTAKTKHGREKPARGRVLSRWYAQRAMESTKIDQNGLPEPCNFFVRAPEAFLGRFWLFLGASGH